MLSTDGQISLLDIQNEFGGIIPIKMSEYYGIIPDIPQSVAGNNPQLRISNFRGKSSTPSIPITNGLYARYTGEGPFTKTGNNITTWNDISGQNRHIITYRGLPQQITSSRGLYGVTGSGQFNIVRGTINDGFKMPFALPQNNIASQSSYTIAYIARYTGDRIIYLEIIEFLILHLVQAQIIYGDFMVM